MAQVFTIEPNPRWVIIDDFSKLPNGAAIYTYRSLNKTEFKPAFQSASNSTPYGQPIIGFGNGTFPPIFWEFDDAAPQETYYIEVWSGLKQEDGGNGVLLWTFDGLSGGSSGGGGSTTTNNDIENLIINGEFYRNCGDIIGSPSIDTLITLAPSNNAGIGGYSNLPDGGKPASDIIFAKNNQTDSDSLTFVPVVGTNNLGTVNPTPQLYVKYHCTVGGTGQTYKYIQFPIVKGLQNLSNANVSVKIWAKLVSGNPSGITLNWRQFFGNGGSPSADVITPIGGGPITLDLNTWKEVTINDVIIPSINFVGSTLGSCGNDALFFQISFPLSDPIDVEFILPAIYLGKVTSQIDFHTLDQVDAIVNSPRTGDIRTSINDVLLGWVNMNDGTIGNASSNATSRANVDTFPLFDLIWNNFQANQSFAPMFTSGGTPVAYGANSVADFTANRQLSLTKNLGRVMAGALPEAASQSFTRNVNGLDVTSSAGFYTGMAVTVSGGSLPTPLVAGTIYYAVIISSTQISLATTTANALAGTVITLTSAGTGTVTSVNDETLGSFIGEESHLQATNEVGVHHHSFSVPFSNQAASRGAGGADTVTNAVAFNSITSNSSQNVPMNIMQPTVYMNVFIKL